MLLTKQILENHRACDRGMLWYTSNGEPASVEETIEKLLAPKAKLLALNEHEKFVWSKRFDWSNWLLSHVLPVDDKIRYAIFAAELVIDIFEKEFPEDKRPRNAIEAAREYLSNKDVAVADAVYAEVVYAEARADDARAAARAVAEVTYAACADYADYAACAAAWAVIYATRATDEADYVETYTKIINYGLSLVKKCDVHCCKTQD